MRPNNNDNKPLQTFINFDYITSNAEQDGGSMRRSHISNVSIKQYRQSINAS